MLKKESLLLSMLVNLLARKKQNAENFNTQLIKMLAVTCTILCTAPLNIGKLSLFLLSQQLFKFGNTQNLHNFVSFLVLTQLPKVVVWVDW